MVLMLQINNSAEANNCVFCLSEISVPARLNCGHLVDLHCIGNWMNQGNDSCPLDRKKIDKVNIENLDPSNTVSLEFRSNSYTMKFYTTLDATVNSVAEVFSAYCEKAYRIEGQIGDAVPITIKGMVFENTSSNHCHGFFKSNDGKLLRDIPLTSGENYKVKVHLGINY